MFSVFKENSEITRINKAAGKMSVEVSHETYKIIQRDFINESDVVRHDPIKLAKTICDLVEWWIK